MEAKLHLYGADPLQEARAELAIEHITLNLLEIETFFNENHDEKGLFTGPGGESSGNVIPTDVHAALEEVHGNLSNALDIVKAHTIEGALISRVMNGVREVQKGNAGRKAASEEAKVAHQKEIDAIAKMPTWRDTNPSKSQIGRVGELIDKAANSLKIRWQRDPEFRKDVYKEVALATASIGLHFFGAAVPEGLAASKAIVEGVVKGIDAAKRSGVDL